MRHPTHSLMISAFSPAGLIVAATLLREAQWTQAIRSLLINLVTTSLNRIAATFSFSGQIISLVFERTRKPGRRFTSNGWPACQEIAYASTRHFFLSMEIKRKALDSSA